METNEKPVEKKKKTGTRRALPITAWILSLVLTAAATLSAVLFIARDEAVILKEALTIIRTNFYFYDADKDSMVDGAIKGMAQSLDDVYSTYYTEEEYADLTRSNSGFYTGIGVVLASEAPGSFLIMQVYANTPAQEAGILVGDYVTELNGTPSGELELADFLQYMHSEDGGENDITVVRDGQLLSFHVVAREIYAETVTYRMLTDTVGYLHLSGFHGECVEEVKEAVEELREQGMEKLVMDVRDNPGGSLSDVCDIADLFLQKGLVITSLRSRTDDQKDYMTSKQGFQFPMALLVNENSASASELLAGALQDHERAYLIGTKTYGKGIVQSYYPVLGTGGYIKITTEAYYTPNGVCIHGIGITPNEEVELSGDAARYSAPRIPYESDVQLQRAVEYLESVTAE